MNLASVKTMQKFVGSPQTTIGGASISAVVSNQLADEIKSHMETVLARYGYKEILPDDWYPDQMYLDILKSRSQDIGAGPNFVAIGMKVIDTAIFPPEIDSIQAALNSLVTVHELNKRNRLSEDTYTIQPISDTHVQVIDGTPYPHDVVYGFIYAMTRRYCPKGHHFKVVRTYLMPDQPDSAGALYDVTW